MIAPLERARALIAEARRVAVLTGAGISAESGVPTFRGEQGLWRSYRPEDLATPQAFAANPLLVWEWYAWRRGIVAGCAPNPGHRALARFALTTGTATIVTQNVDGLHGRAAHDAARDLGDTDPAPALPVEVHGAIDRDRCSRCDRRSPGSHEIDLTDRDTLPRCVECDGLLRPDVVWFGEALEPAVLSRAFTVAGEADVCLVVGTSALVHPAASIPLATLERGGAVIEVNIGGTPLTTRAAVTLRGPSGEILPELLDADGRS